MSGILQGSVLCPLLFVIYIYDMPEVIHNLTMLFADDSKVFSVIENAADQTQLQEDLNSLTSWAEKWQLHFNCDKCKVVHWKAQPWKPIHNEEGGAAVAVARESGRERPESAI